MAHLGLTGPGDEERVAFLAQMVVRFLTPTAPRGDAGQLIRRGRALVRRRRPRAPPRGGGRRTRPARIRQQGDAGERRRVADREGLRSPRQRRRSPARVASRARAAPGS